MKKKIKIGTLISGGGTNLQAIIDSCANGKIYGEIVFTGSDVAGVKGLERAKKAGIDTFVVDYKKIIKGAKENLSSLVLPNDFNIEEIKAKQQLISNRDLNKEQMQKIEFFLKTRAVAEKELLNIIIPYKIDLLVLAGFMRTFTPYFIDRITNAINTISGQENNVLCSNNNILDENILNKSNSISQKHKIMNIHPALLPAFPGTDGYGDTFRYGCKVGGCTVHYIDYGEDTGPIIGQRAFQIEDGDTLEIVKQKGLALEWELYPECIQKFAMGLV
ncbi:MAG: phosphoribosylglycinamide formyltransferase [Desulfamplus sp.]|nr:phosphoribosylglycinamide formyltransferase [Desulfamplus sp.]